MIRAEELFAPRGRTATLDQPLGHLLACHRRIEERLSVLKTAAARIEERRADALSAFENAFRFFDSSGVLHTADEEESLFPRLLPRLEPGERIYLAGLEHDHTEAHLVYTELKGLIAAGALVPAVVQGLVERLVALYRRHIASEDADLQAYASRLSEADLAAIAAEMKARRAPPSA